MRRNYTAEFKAKMALAMLKEEREVSQLAAEHAINPNQLYRWRDEALAGLPSVFTSQPARQLGEQQAAHANELQQLYAEIGRLTTELNWLKKRLPS